MFEYFSHLYYFPSKVPSDNVDTVNKVRGHVSCLQNIMVAKVADVCWFSSVSVAQVTRNKLCRSKINYDNTTIFEEILHETVTAQVIGTLFKRIYRSKYF